MATRKAYHFLQVRALSGGSQGSVSESASVELSKGIYEFEPAELSLYHFLG